MPTRRGVLDSSPIPIPPAQPRSNPLKRSASTASLPTPPRTVHKSRRGRGRAIRGRRGAGSSTEEEEGREEDEDVGVASNPRKKRKTLETIVEAEGSDEDGFWMGSSTSKSKTEQKEKPSAPTTSTSKRPRTRSQSPYKAQAPQSPSKTVAIDRIKAPLSPPRSRRQAAPPVTPPRKTRSATRLEQAGPSAVRDSPENPFLDTPESLAGSPGARTPPPKHPALPLEERPTITYVFRGKKAEFVNPHYGASPSARERALLPPEHPDFEPDETCPPKILFSATRRRRAAPKTKSKKPAVKSEWDTTDEEDGGEEVPETPRKKVRTGTANPTPKDQGVSVANGEVDEPLRRALGPARSSKR
ncbi:hypothetical protein OE88DRAFT_1665907 [Heliocybe sulcata]|uniref:Uncharacterized protein n=1 Tax=Heliocybe sulcata TaxID=5364 RepID=A0A5C3MS78_9AGAM|nr:hypothetical protein OE88DRAFT_1665907 [Heliocybe sulcata]